MQAVMKCMGYHEQQLSMWKPRKIMMNVWPRTFRLLRASLSLAPPAFWWRRLSSWVITSMKPARLMVQLPLFKETFCTSAEIALGENLGEASPSTCGLALLSLALPVICMQHFQMYGFGTYRQDCVKL